MKLKLIAAGFENYTGQMGVINFTAGLSDSDVLAVDAIRVAGVIGAEWEDGTPANVSQLYLDNMNTPAPTAAEQSQVIADAASADPTAVEEQAIQATADAIGIKYTPTELALIADEQGIAGLRAISESLGIKGNSINGLITAILKVAGVDVPVVEQPVGDVPVADATATTGV